MKFYDLKIIYDRADRTERYSSVTELLAEGRTLSPKKYEVRKMFKGDENLLKEQAKETCPLGLRHDVAMRDIIAAVDDDGDESYWYIDSFSVKKLENFSYDLPEFIDLEEEMPREPSSKDKDSRADTAGL